MAFWVNRKGRRFRVHGSGLDLNPTAYIGKIYYLFIIYSFDILFASLKECQITFFFFLKKVPPYGGGSISNPEP